MVEVNRWPLVGTLARGMNTLFVNRSSRRDALRANHAITVCLEKGHGLLVFPESTTSYGDQVLPLKTALLEPAVLLHMPVHVAAISYTTPPGEPTPEDVICWVDDTPFATHALRLLALRRFDVRVAFGAHPVHASDRKLLAGAAHRAIETLLFTDKRAHDTRASV